MSCYSSAIAQPLHHPDFNLDVLLYRADGEWVGHCLQLDLVEAGATAEEAEENLTGVIQHHIQWALEDDDMEHLFHPAPPEVWKQFFGAKAKGFREIPLSIAAARTFTPLAFAKTSAAARVLSASGFAKRTPVRTRVRM